MSLLPSPLKSPVPAIDQAVGTLPTQAVDETDVPFMNQIATIAAGVAPEDVALAVAVEVAGSDDRSSWWARCRDRR